MIACQQRLPTPDRATTVGAFLRSLFADPAERKLCGAPARWVTRTGEPLCDACAERFVDAVMSDATILGMVAAKVLKPRTRETARQYYLRPLD